MHKIMKSMISVSLITALTSAYALEAPKRSKEDQRIQYVNYSKDDVVRVNAANGYITTIVFSKDEVVKNYGSGFSTAWEFATADNQFFLKPKDREGTTNLVIVTNKHIYNLDVFLVEKAQSATYKLTFKYPQDEAFEKNKQKQEKHIQDLLNKEDRNINEAQDISNFAYTMNFGETATSKLIAPTSIYDNGRFTYIHFQPNTDFPAVYSVNSDGEALVNSHIEKDVLVVHGVYSEMRFRAGADVVGIYNEAFGRISKIDSDNTTVQGLKRSMKD